MVRYGDAALLVVFGERIDPALNQAVHGLASGVRADQARGRPWRTPVPGYATLLVSYDALRWSHGEATAEMEKLVATASPASGVAEDGKSKVLEVPVRYGGQDGPDLRDVAERCRLSTTDVVEMHASTTYRAYLLGFAPGFAYLGTLPEPLHLPRLGTPRQRVPAGSVAIAGGQTAIYPLSTPGGWHIIGRTTVPVWEPRRDPPALIAAGSRVRFLPLAG
ncbi:5-oxoprolinase subunit PxpB [soil metagenome]